MPCPALLVSGFRGQCELAKPSCEMPPPGKDVMLGLGVGWGGKPAVAWAASTPLLHTHGFLAKLLWKAERCPLSNTCSCCFGRALRQALPLLWSVISASCQRVMRNANKTTKQSCHYL